MSRSLWRAPSPDGSSMCLWSTTTASHRRKSGRSRRPERGSAPSATICGRSGRWPRSNRRGPTRSSPKEMAATPARLRRSGLGSAGPRPSSISGGKRVRVGNCHLLDLPTDDRLDLEAERPGPQGVEADQRIAKLRANAVVFNAHMTRHSREVSLPASGEAARKTDIREVGRVVM
jgi:hypothetical protein